MADVKELEAKFRSLPRGTQESNKAFKAWKDAVNSGIAESEAPEPAAPRKASRRTSK